MGQSMLMCEVMKVSWLWRGDGDDYDENQNQSMGDNDNIARHGRSR